MDCRRVVWLALVALAGASATDAVAANGQIAFTSGHDYPSTPPMDVLLADPFDRRPPHLLARGGGSASGTTFSPDGRRVVYGYETVPHEGTDLFLARVDGRGVARRLTSPDEFPGDETDPTFDPSGRFLLFVADGSAWGAVYVLDLVGGRLTRLTDTVTARSPAFSPDGLHVVFVRRREGLGGTELAMMDSDGGGLRALPVGAGASSVDWSWSTGQLVFDDGAGNINLATPEGGAVRSGPGGRFPRFSPDGAQIVYTDGRDGMLSVWDLRRGTVRALGLRTTSRPAWQPLTRPNHAPCDQVRLRTRRVRVSQRWRRVRWIRLRDRDGDRLRVEPAAPVPQPWTIQLGASGGNALRVRERVDTRLRHTRYLRLPYTVFDERGERCNESVRLTIVPSRSHRRSTNGQRSRAAWS